MLGFLIYPGSCVIIVSYTASHAVSYEAANTLISISSAPTAVRAAIAAYSLLLQQESDNNIKLIILNRLLGMERDTGLGLAR